MMPRSGSRPSRLPDARASSARTMTALLHHALGHCLPQRSPKAWPRHDGTLQRTGRRNLQTHGRGQNATIKKLKCQAQRARTGLPAPPDAVGPLRWAHRSQHPQSPRFKLLSIGAPPLKILKVGARCVSSATWISAGAAKTVSTAIGRSRQIHRRQQRLHGILNNT